MKDFYDASTVDLMRLHYVHLSEKDRRHYAAIECKKLGFGGGKYIMSILNISQKTLEKGVLELSNPSLYAEIPIGKIRRPGGGRKKNLPSSR